MRCPAAPVLDVVAQRPDEAADAVISVAELGAAGHVILGPAGEEYLLLRDSEQAVTLRLYGSRVSIAPVAASFVVEATAQAGEAVPAVKRASDLLFRSRHRTHGSRERLLARDALIAVDADCAGASLRETAELIHGVEFVRREWSGGNGWLKLRMRRARAKGRELCDGGYRRWLQGGCRCSA